MIKFILIACIIVPFIQDEFVLQYRKVGPLEIGFSVEEIYNYFDKDNETGMVDRYLEASFSPAVVIRNNNEILFFANLDCDKIYSFEVVNEKYKTSKNVSVGSSFALLCKMHKVTSIEQAEGRIFAIVDELHMSFALETMKLLQKKIDINSPLKPMDIPNDIKVKSIIVY